MSRMKSKIEIPIEVSDVAAKLMAAGFEAYLVGGCVRDILIDREPKDWDVATNAKPDEVQKIFPDSVYENDFGTVLVKPESQEPGATSHDGEKRKNNLDARGSMLVPHPMEVTTYRIEGKYSDSRHPDEIK